MSTAAATRTAGTVTVVLLMVLGLVVPAQAAAPDPATLLAQAAKALSAQRAFQVTMQSGSGSQQSMARVVVTGRGSVGTLSQPGSGTVKVIGTPRRIFLKGDAEFRASLGRRAAKRLGHRWLALSTGSALGLGYGGKADGSLPAARAFASLSSVRDLVGSVLNDRISPTLAGRREIAGVPAVGVRSGSMVVWLRAVGAPLPLAFDEVGGASAQGSFGEWGTRTRVVIPKRSVKAETLPGLGRTNPGSGGGRITGGRFKNTLIAPGAGMVGVRLGDTPAAVRSAVGKPYDITAGTNVFGPFSMWHYGNKLHIDLNDGRVVGLSLSGRGARTADGIGIGSRLSRLTSTYSVQCAHGGSSRWTDCTLGDTLIGAVVTTFRAERGVIREISIVRIVD